MKSFLVKCAAKVGRFIAYLVAILPRSARAFLGDIIGVLWFDVLRIRRNVAVENIALSYPQLKRSQATSMARSSLRHMGRSIVEFSLFPFFTRDRVPEYFDIRGLEHLEAAYAKGRGVLMLGSHLGNGDFGVAALSRLGWQVSLISKTFRTKWLNDLWFGMRSEHGTQFISPEKSSFQILRALKSKRIVFFVLDQFMGPPIGCRTKFFGRETGTAMGLAIMAERSGAPVLPSYTFREENGRHVIVFEPEIPWQDASTGGVEDHDANIASMTQIYTDKIEAMIRLHPEQWMWIHRRWKNF